MPDVLRLLAEQAARTAVLVDFDGSLAPIVDDPNLARALPETRDALADLVGRISRVAVVSGRPVAFLRDALRIDGATYVGQYGLERWVDGRVVTDPRVEPYLGAVDAAATGAEQELRGVFVERKGPVAVALHWRNRPELAGAVRDWAEAHGATSGLELHPGKMVVELRPPVPMDKGTVVEELADGMAAVAFAGDDSGDLAAFDALDRLRDDGRVPRTVRIAVRSPEEPPDLVARADVSVDGPAGLAALLRDLGAAISRAPA